MAKSEPTERIKRTIEAEATASERASKVVRPPTFDNPAVGLVINGGISDTVAGAILRADQAGYHVIVTYDHDPDPESIEFARQLGVTVIDPAFDQEFREDPVEFLARGARKYGFPGVIHHKDPAERIDYVGSEEKLHATSDYLVEAEPAPVINSVPEVLVGIPAYNEESTIATVVSGASTYSDSVLVVDDGSDDDTEHIAREADATVISHEENQGYGAALKTIFTEADRIGAEHLVILDGDGQHEPAHIPRLVEEQADSDAEVVIGCRFGEETGTDLPLYRRVGLTIVNFLTNLSLGVVRPRSRVRDTQSGFRAYDRRAIESLASDVSIGDHMGASTDILHHAQAHDYAIEEVGTTVDYDVENGSNHNPIQHGITLVMNLVRTIERQRPISALGVPGLVSVFVGIGFGYFALQLFLENGSFPIGSTLASIFFILIGVFSAFTAIILHALNTLNLGQAR